MLIALLVLLSVLSVPLGPEIISVLLGDQWLSCGSFKILALACSFGPVTNERFLAATGSYTEGLASGITPPVFSALGLTVLGVAGVAYGILWLFS
jgi:hypothetical protein